MSKLLVTLRPSIYALLKELARSLHFGYSISLFENFAFRTNSPDVSLHVTTVPARLSASPLALENSLKRFQRSGFAGNSRNSLTKLSTEKKYCSIGRWLMRLLVSFDHLRSCTQVVLKIDRQLTDDSVATWLQRHENKAIHFPRNRDNRIGTSHE